MVIALGVLTALLAAILLYVALQPSAFRIARTTTIQAPPDAIFPLIASPRRFNTWNPFAKSDPEAELVYSGPDSGPGAAYTWAGKKTGHGRLEVTSISPSRLIEMQLDFIKPFAARNTAEFALAPNGDETTTVTWAMLGHRSFAHKLMGTVFSADKMLGGAFASGLADLKAMAEADNATP